MFGCACRRHRGWARSSTRRNSWARVRGTGYDVIVSSVTSPIDSARPLSYRFPIVNNSLSPVVSSYLASKRTQTPPTPTRRNCRVESRRRFDGVHPKRPQTKTATKLNQNCHILSASENSFGHQIVANTAEIFISSICQQVHYCVHEARNPQFLQTNYYSLRIIISYRELHLN